MPIYKPVLALSQADREALVLLGQLIISSENGETSNLPRESVALSPAEAARLLNLLEQFASSKLFVEGSYFAEGIANGNGGSNDRLREIYLSWRSKRGHSRIASGFTWREFVFRVGFNSSDDAWMWPRQVHRSPLRPMTLQHFVSMEKRLMDVANLHPRVAELVTAFVENSLDHIERVRARKAVVRDGSIRWVVDQTISDISDHIGGRERNVMSRRKIIALSTIIMDTAAMFTTRDWTAAGVISSIAAVVPDALELKQ